MADGHIKNPGWREPMEGEYLHAVPMGPQSDWQALLAHARDPRLHNLGIGMDAAPSAAELEECAWLTPDVAFWELFGRDDPHQRVGYLVYSVWTNLPCVAVYLFEPSWNEAWWREGLSLLTDKFFSVEQQRHTLYAHFLPPVSDDTEAWVIELGFAPTDQALYSRPLERKIYGIAREVYDMFHEEIDDEEFDDEY